MGLYDMHCHIGFAKNASAVAARAAHDGTHFLNCTVEPRSFEPDLQRFSGYGNVAVGLGIHPWWVADGSVNLDDVHAFCELAAGCALIGEVGLDFGKRHGVRKEEQVCAFEHVARACSCGGKVLSIHAVNAADVVLDMLEQKSSLAGNTCIFHWFSGSSQQLTRALQAGCYFSVNAMMLDTRRGREYARQIPLGRLLLETDWPELDVGELEYEAYEAELKRVAKLVEDIRGVGALEAIEETSAAVFAQAAGA